MTSSTRINRLVWLVMAVFVFASLGVAALIYGKLTRQGLGALDAWLADARPWFTALRWSLLAAVIGFWPQWIEKLAEQAYLDPLQRRRARTMRWRVAAWLVALDLLFAERLWQRFGEHLTVWLEE